MEGCRLKCDIRKDAVITYDDVTLPPDRLADRLRAEQYRKFRGEFWLEDLLSEPNKNDVAVSERRGGVFVA